MEASYRQFFALTREPFGADLPRKDLLVTKALHATEDRIHYALRLGAVALVTGEIGSGKSTPLR
jgi:general secretion pathway protein A